MEFNTSVAKAASAFFGALRSNAIAGIAFAVIVFFAYVLHLSAGVVAVASNHFLYFAALAVFVVSMALAVLIVVSRHKPVVNRKQ